MASAQSKTCTNSECPCENPQPLSAFGKHRGRSDGLDSRCKTCEKARNKKRYAGNRRRIQQQVREYNQTEAAIKKRRIRQANATDWKKLNNKLANRLYNFVIRGKKGSLNRATMGCTYAEIRAHIEAQFKNGMTWDNYADVWNFDHIVPYAAFPTVEELDKHHKIVCWFKNVRPLPPPDNRGVGRADYNEEDKQALIRRYQLWEIEREALQLI